MERGGSVTFHGPGQIVVYPVVYLKGKKLSVKNYVWTLEEIMIETLKELGISSYRLEKKRGVFTEKGKIGFVGVKISRNISYHGFS
ncbi:MAG: lipoyl(octanoyl) transferase LipB [Persephonella sp.]|nr:lipoyl(octanoyl) transferase LipB [Persephonella sp.]